MEKRTPTVQGGGRVCSTNTSYSARRQEKTWQVKRFYHRTAGQCSWKNYSTDFKICLWYLASMSFLESTPNESYRLECNFFEIVSKMREVTIQGIKDCERILSDRQFGRKVLIDCEFEAAQKTDSPDTKVIWISDCSKFEDYELDFGYGKPIWASLADVLVEVFMILMNTKENDGIEAWVFMHESHMPYLTTSLH
ncbi:Pelargonidin 3-O-(6-caffeoylglucoside) 5-O-(6-O-malonylglucoside) 4'''-malonyltransferase [Sesamum alatum]|uniref:Pelargonidin 3-O-(6-caffeoylglucoside) 5-O-(6-O-malonylglucoside) 4'''-malonyltransferase n=1 Tax=Sesamum alatum TaxID=300844 RepID=A0AAE1Y7U5_9LAMI|nr:Pelargonidin 3-O-(6-caffeoylglucoside) 5-O-(6-O-malonylglucoside) 4'''-malonyltransferase [Sesamum alatum]